MERFVTSTQLKQELRAVKEYASQDLVHVLENGRSEYVLISSDVYEQKMETVRAWAQWMVNVDGCLEESQRDLADGRILPLVDVPGWEESGASADVYITYSSRWEMADLEAELPASDLHDMVAEACKFPQRGVAVEYSSAQHGLADVAEGSSTEDATDRHRTTGNAATLLGTVRKAPVPPYDLLYTRDAACAPLLICGFVRSFVRPAAQPDLDRLFDTLRESLR